MDPCGNLPVRIEWKGRVVAGFRRMGALERLPRRGAGSREGEIERLEPSEHPPVTFERGVSTDPAFAKWAGSSQVPEDLVVRLFDDGGREERALRICHCVVATFEAKPAGEHEVAIARLGLLNEGWEPVPPPADPAPRVPAGRD